MRVIRFIDEIGVARFGTDVRDGTAQIIAGDLFGEHVRTDERARVRKVLAPVAPPNVFGFDAVQGDARGRGGAEIPHYPATFMKATTTLADPGELILVPKCCEEPEVDSECKLAVVIARAARDVSEAEALSHVYGYTVANEITARRWAGISQTRGKCFDRFCPIGPELVTADEIPDPQALTLTTTVNGTVVRKGSTADMVPSVAALISYLSQDTTLLPGTLILAGAPPSAGFADTPRLFLMPGDDVSVEIDVIGSLANPVGCETSTVSRAA